MEAHDFITGSVARVVSETELILNRGSDQGVTEGMYFHVLESHASEIKDPEDEDRVESLRLVKVAVQVVDVAQNMALARTFRTVTVNVGGNGPDVSGLLGFTKSPKYVQEVEKFSPAVGESIYQAPGRSIISVGDPVREAQNREDALRTVVFDF